MRNFILFLSSCAVCLIMARIVVGFTLEPLEQQARQAKLELKSPTTTVQYSASEEIAIAEFEIGNRGDRRLVVNSKSFDCDCYLGKEGSLAILPGRTERLRIPISMQAIARYPQIKFLLITNDPDNARFQSALTFSTDRRWFLPVRFQ